MAATTAPSPRIREPNRPTNTRRKKEQRTDIWSNLLRQTREAQARSRTHAVQARDLVLCGGSPEDQQTFVERFLARPAPTQPAARNQRDQRPQQSKGEVRLSNRFGYGYGHVTLYSPPQSSSATVGLFNGEVEEAAKLDIHTIPEPEQAYEDTLRRLLVLKKPHSQQQEQQNDEEGEEITEREVADGEGRRAAVCILMSWKEPWVFLLRLRRWLALLSRALLPASAQKNESPLEVIREHQISLTVVLQHTDHQELLLRESYTEESFDYVSQCLRICLLPISAALLYVPTNLPPQQPGGALSEVQKVLYTSLDLNIAALQTKGGKPEITPKYNVVDRMAIVVPSGWDSAGKIRLLSETFSPEAVLEGWMTDLSLPVFPTTPPPAAEPLDPVTPKRLNGEDGQTNGGAEVYESSHQPSPLVVSPHPSPPPSPSKMPKSAIADYEYQIQDPNAHKAPKPPEIEVTTKSEQDFLAEMRTQLQHYEAQDASKATHTSTTPGQLNTGRFNAAAMTSAATGEALSELGDVSFNVGGVSYNTLTAEQAIERLKRPQTLSSSDSRSSTPRLSKREQRDGSDGTPGSKGGEIPTEKLEEYFASLMKRGGGGSQSGTPTKH